MREHPQQPSGRQARHPSPVAGAARTRTAAHRQWTPPTASRPQPLTTNTPAGMRPDERAAITGRLCSRSSPTADRRRWTHDLSAQPDAFRLRSSPTARPEATCARAGRPVDLADPDRAHPPTSGPRPRQRSPAALAAALTRRHNDARPGRRGFAHLLPRLGTLVSWPKQHPAGPRTPERLPIHARTARRPASRKPRSRPRHGESDIKREA